MYNKSIEIEINYIWVLVIFHSLNFNCNMFVKTAR